MIPELTDNLKLYGGGMDQRPKKVTTMVKHLYAAMDKKRMTAASAEDGYNSDAISDDEGIIYKFIIRVR